MESYKEEFIDFLYNSDALKFGEFTLKSGRKSPFFMNLGELNSSAQLVRLGNAYAEAVYDNFGRDVDVFFGPAYKGISLAVATAIQFQQMFGKSIRFASSRKEVKDHGDTGIMLGSKLRNGDRVVMIEDVTTSGKSMDETIPIVKAQADVKILGEVVSLDRMEYGTDRTKTALQEVAEKYDMKTFGIVSMKDVCDHLQGRAVFPIGTICAIREYYEEYGVEGVQMI